MSNLSTDDATRHALLEEHYPSPTGEPYFVIDDAACGRLEVLPKYAKVKGKGVPAPPAAYLSFPDGDCVAPPWLAIEDALDEALVAQLVVGDVVRGTFGRLPIRWTPPAPLVKPLRALMDRPDGWERLAVDARAAIAGFAPLLAARVHLDALVQAAADALGIALDGGVVLPSPFELTLAVDEAIAAAAADEPEGDGFGSLTLAANLETLLPSLRLAKVKVPVIIGVETSGEIERGRHADYVVSRRGRYVDGVEWLVRPTHIAADDVVQTLALRAGIPALIADELPETMVGEPLPLVHLAADSVTALPALSALVTPGLRLVRAASGSEADQVLATVADGAFEPADPVLNGRIEAWLPAMHADVRTARRALTAEAKAKALAFITCSFADLPGVVGTNARVLAYALDLDESESILPWWEATATRERYTGVYVIDVTEYQRELAGELLRITRPDLTLPIRAASQRLLRLADEIERLATPALGEAAALGCPEPALRALNAPLGALLGVLRAATEERLMRQNRAGELALAALSASLAVDAASAAPTSAPAPEAP